MKGIIQFFARFSKWIPDFVKKTPQDAASFAIGMATSEVLTPFIKPASYSAWAARPVNKAGAPDYIEAYFKGVITEGTLRKELREMGFNDQVIDMMVKTRQSLLSVGDIQTLYNRGELSETEAHQRLKEMGFDARERKEILSLAGYIPTVPDFIRMAVREVFTPDIAQKYGLFEDYPEELTRLAKMAGLNPEYAKYYWAAHWDLPSMTEGFEMYHRGIITYDELKTLLRSLDVMPYWREKLIKLSETPFTRVDVRRMYQLGVLSFEEMVKAYQDLGYSKEKAEKMARFVQTDVMEEERNLSKTEVTTLYREGVLNRDDAFSFLRDLGYPEEHANYILALEDMRISAERFRLIKSAVKRRYVRGLIDRNDVVVLLSKWGISSQEIEKAVEAWDLEKEEVSAIPTKAELFRFFKKGIIDRETLKDMLRKLGYEQRFVDWYIKDLEGGE